MSNARTIADLANSTFSGVGPGSVGPLELTSTLDLSTKTIILPSGLTPPTGTVVPFAGPSAPSGWLFCFGQTVSRTTYAALFTALGTTYGAGDGSTTFVLPDLRGRVPSGKDNMGGSAASRLTTAGSGVDGATLGASGGAQSHTLTEAQMPSHTHTASTASSGAHTHTVSSLVDTGTKDLTGSESTYTVGTQTTSSAGAHTHTVTVNNTGSGSAHNNTQPTLVVNYIIKT